MGICAKCGAYIPEGQSRCLSCGFTPGERSKAAPSAKQAPEQKKQLTREKPEKQTSGPALEKQAPAKAPKQAPAKAPKQTRRQAPGKLSQKELLLTIVIIVAVISAVLITATINSKKPEKSYVREGAYDLLEPGCYYFNGDTVYYLSTNSRTGKYDWWTWTKGGGEWELACAFSEKKAPEGLAGSEMFRSGSELEEAIGCDMPYIGESRAYMDVYYYRREPNGNNYYYYKGNLYYYFPDVDGTSYGKADHSGWYRFDSAAGEWVFVGRHDDPEIRTTLGDFWYDYKIYRMDEAAGRLSDYFPEGVWSEETEFENTVWYREYAAYKQADNAVAWRDGLKYGDK